MQLIVLGLLSATPEAEIPFGIFNYHQSADIIDDLRSRYHHVHFDTGHNNVHFTLFRLKKEKCTGRLAG